MSELVSMKISAKERKKMTEPMSIATDGPQYPYGLSLSLDGEALAKLKLSIKDLEVGGTLALVAKVRVSSLSKNEHEGGHKNENVGLQITDLCLEAEGADASKAAKSLYNEGDE
jgi:hypothetical protein